MLMVVWMLLLGRKKSGWWWPECTQLLTYSAWDVAQLWDGNMWDASLLHLCFLSYFCSQCSNTFVLGTLLLMSGSCSWEEPKIQSRKVHPWEVIRLMILPLWCCATYVSLAYERCGFFLFSCCVWLSRFKVLGPDGSNYSITQDTQMAGSDADDVWLFFGVLTIQLFWNVHPRTERFLSCC